MDIEKAFRTYLEQKHIDPDSFSKQEPERWAAFLKLFGAVSPKSFTQQKLFLINSLRRKYHLPEPPKAEEPNVKKVVKTDTSETKPKRRIAVRKARPKIRVKTKSEKADEQDTTAPDAPQEG